MKITHFISSGEFKYNMQQHHVIRIDSTYNNDYVVVIKCKQTLQTI